MTVQIKYETIHFFKYNETTKLKLRSLKVEQKNVINAKS